MLRGFLSVNVSVAVLRGLLSVRLEVQGSEFWMRLEIQRCAEWL